MPAVVRVVLLGAAAVFSCAMGGQPSPVEAQLAAARKAVEATPGEAGAWMDLARSLLQQARASASGALLVEATAAIDRAEAIAGAGPAGQKLRVEVLLRRKQYREALAEAARFNEANRDDIEGYGLLAEAQMALGQTSDAERNVQWMLDLRRNDPETLTRTGQFRLHIHDPEGALQMLEPAYQRVPETELERRSFLLCLMAQAYKELGRTKEAAESRSLALQTVPGYAPALERGRAPAKTAQLGGR